MDARVTEDPQKRSSIKRPWDEDTSLAGKVDGWRGAALPPIEAVSYHRPQISRRTEAVSAPHIRFDREAAESGPKKPRYGWDEHNHLSEERGGLNGKVTPSRPSNSTYSHHNGTSQVQSGSPSFPPNQREQQTWEARREPSRPSSAFDTSGLCRRCKRELASDLQLPQGCEDCRKNPELAYVTQAAAAGLTQLAEILGSGISSEQWGVIRTRGLLERGPAECPNIAQAGLKQTLDWIVSRIYHLNDLAEHLIRHGPSETSSKPRNTLSQNSVSPREGLTSAMKRQAEAEADHEIRPRPDAPDPPSGTHLQDGWRSISREDPPSARSQADYYHPHAVDSPSRRTVMNPPPAPTVNRQLPSPPGRSVSSPTSLSFPSPSAASYGSTTAPVNLPPPSSLQSGYLPPIGTSQPPDSALQTHTAALQHEVSVQKIAFSSLQGEHDKLLAAYSRSQTRASALEKKHNVSDAEIINLTEEKLRLQNQVIDLERDVEILTRSRDECRQSAVQEGAQYVEIVRQASFLEEKTAEERKNWNVLKAQLEKKLEALNGSGRTEVAKATDITPKQAAANRTDALISPTEKPLVLKLESMSEVLTHSEPSLSPPVASEIRSPNTGTSRTAVPPSTQAREASMEELREEVRHLEGRCFGLEETLHAVREESRSMERMIEGLTRVTKSVADKASSALEMR